MQLSVRLWLGLLQGLQQLPQLWLQLLEGFLVCCQRLSLQTSVSFLQASVSAVTQSVSKQTGSQSNQPSASLLHVNDVHSRK